MSTEISGFNHLRHTLLPTCLFSPKALNYHLCTHFFFTSFPMLLFLLKSLRPPPSPSRFLLRTTASPKSRLNANVIYG